MDNFFKIFDKFQETPRKSRKSHEKKIWHGVKQIYIVFNKLCKFKANIFKFQIH